MSEQPYRSKPAGADEHPEEGMSCPECLGTGFLVRAGEDGVERARVCPCRDREREDRLLRAARIPRRYQQCSLGNFEKHHATQETARQFARRFVQKYPLGEMGLLLTGPCGTGKTHLAISVLKELITERGLTCLFYDFQDLLKEIQGSYGPESTLRENQILQPVFTADVLLLDDLGAQKPTAWVRDTVGHIINHRYNNRRVSLFTTNRRVAPDDEVESGRGGRELTEATLLDQIGQRIHSRIHEMCKVVPIEGPDYRKLTKQPGLHSLMVGPPGRRPDPRAR
jgi:DNA replication protein DnaC